ncbi:LPS export ABC transporter periplasmic protein LptC [Marinomonas ostreistagni]|uniref:LPS export ABC transporter periplasmic protein LptC n=1 Tax=Marinomonas ostreistagni TaxID=359209 RepID=UPI00194E35E2|nr:LPS export ABC transporter periplasmic protein LptC [Marinomonas ostreistagni]MBM6549855.1 LPS export ABC transporter periplasmic protein LptC [Marinomonas ostreistagni]
MSIMRTFLGRKRLTGLAAGVVVIAGVFWLGSQPSLLNILDEQKLEQVPDFFLEGVESRTYGVEGNLQEIVTADTTTHYAEQRTELINPNIERRNGAIITVAVGNEGTLVDASESFSLIEDASVTRYQDGNETARINAHSITYDDANQNIFGEGDSELITKQGTTLSDNISFDLIKDTATLNGGVTGHYDVSQP